MAFLAAMYAALWFWLGFNFAGFAGGSGAAVVGLWQKRTFRRQLAQETGIRPRQIPVIARRLRKGHVPADPAARHAMTVLLRRQRKAARSGLRWLPWLDGFYLVLGTIYLTAGVTGFGVFCLMIAVLLAAAWAAHRRTTRRLDRAEAQLIPPSTPPATTGPAYGS
ncbi:hypothetical protein [Streptomyces sp. CBMA29]|uniref:hypothetical protein n=1 Tax=Streptomyces sp. CBMA29 TaxID=1896314 RepID=UPI001661EFE7|nr:hypothetical protein [Streptomyces sp. CBMA29]